MSPLQIVILALIQGITEFLPISSSAHLILAPRLADWPDQGPLIDVMAHAGTLLAVVLYFRKDVGEAVMGGVDVLRGRFEGARARLALAIAAATPPVFVVGFALYALDLVDALRSLTVIAWATLGFGALLWLADRFASTGKTLHGLGWRAGLSVGLAQTLALIPGASRSGVTMTAARALGFDRQTAAKFSMLIAIPPLLAFSALAVRDLAQAPAGAASLVDGLWVAGLSFVSALAAIALLLRWLANADFTVFVLYRLALGAGLLWLAAGS
ncbi:MAG: undecaprenyl-diphosphate phosphatase [Maricaulaceae bacterium]